MRKKPIDKGDELTPETLVGRYAPVIMAVVNKRIFQLRRRGLSREDAFQMVAESLLRWLKTYDPAKSHPSTWLTRGAGFALTEVLRKNKIVRTSTRGTPFLQESNTYASVEARETAQKVRAAISHLPAVQQRVVLMSMSGMSDAEISKSGIVETRARSKIFHIRRKAYQSLREMLHDPIPLSRSASRSPSRLARTARHKRA